ncbi:MAG TPA: hypothetical protein VLE20_14610 [Blastocatellia bacterium]|nr:hypothetical protein [Blastocatellia bacterium]
MTAGLARLGRVFEGAWSHDQDIPVGPWRDSLLKLGLPVHLVNHLATRADQHRAGRFDRMSDDMLTLTGQGPMSVQEFVTKNAVVVTASAKSLSVGGCSHSTHLTST